MNRGILCSLAALLFYTADAQQLEIAIGYFQPDSYIQNTVGAGPELMLSYRLARSAESTDFFASLYFVGSMATHWKNDGVVAYRVGPGMEFAEFGGEFAVPIDLGSDLSVQPSAGLGLSRYWGEFSIPVVSEQSQRDEIMISKRLNLRVQWSDFTLRAGYVFRSIEGLDGAINMGGAGAAIGYVVRF